LITALAALQRRLTTADIARLCGQASVLLETWMVAARHILLTTCWLVGRGYHVLFNELLGNFL
jgi:hypothetical protein